MEKGILSDSLSELIENKTVISAIFTTYVLEILFFELEIVPLILNRNIALSTDDRVKIVQVREALRESGLKIDLFYDKNVFQQNMDISPSMEYGTHGIDLGCNAFHAKNIYLLVKDNDTEEKTLLIGVGSNNLTKAGWWDNIEVQHWVEIKDRGIKQKFKNQLKNDLSSLNNCSNLSGGSGISSIGEYVDNLITNSDSSDIYYSSLDLGRDKPRSLKQFFKDVKPGTLDRYNNWNIEIISPFFAEDADNNLHNEIFNSVGIRNIKILLPIDSDNTALCTEEYYKLIDEEENIEWATWNKEYIEALGLKSNIYRRLHAKIYHFYNGVQSWSFVGSTNFSHKACYDNVETGFFMKHDHIPNGMLSSIKTENDLNFAVLEVLKEGEERTQKLPKIEIMYDWKNEKLIGLNTEKSKICISLKNNDNDIVISDWDICDTETEYTRDKNSFIDNLKQGAIFTLILNDDTFSEHKIMIQQINWSHKPFDYGYLTIEQILAIYAGMSPEKRAILITNQTIKHLIDFYDSAGELTEFDSIDTTDYFFCEYAQIFNAMSELKKILKVAKEEGNNERVDYYLSGTGLDSLPSLISEAKVDDKEKIVTTYLTLLSVKEIYNDFINISGVINLYRDIDNKISEIKKSKIISLGSNTDRTTFFDWFEEEFYKSYNNVESGVTYE